MKEIGIILLVEDDPHDVELSLAALEEAHLVNEVDVVNDGAQALDYLFRREQYAGRTSPRPSVVLLDIKLPKVDGLEVLRQIRVDTQLRTMPVVLLTASREERDIVKAYEYGTNAYVEKPLRFEDFIDAIRQLGIFWAVLNVPPPARRVP